MTREQAIDRLISIMSDLNEFCNESKHMSDDDREEMESLDMAIKALKQEPCEDAVSRKAVDLLCFEFLRANSDDNCAFYERFRDLPPVTPTRKESEWQQDHAILKAHSDGANEVIDRIKKARNEVANYSDFHREHLYKTNPNYDVEQGQYLAYEKCFQILDKLIAEVEGKDATERK